MYPIGAVSLFGKVPAIDKGRLTVWLSWTTKKRGWVAAVLWHCWWLSRTQSADMTAQDMTGVARCDDGASPVTFHKFLVFDILLKSVAGQWEQ